MQTFFVEIKCALGRTYEVASALAEAARLGSRVELYENEFVIDLLTVDGRCVGALTLNLDDGGLTPLMELCVVDHTLTKLQVSAERVDGFVLCHPR